MEKDDFFIDENRLAESRKDELSPSGKYRLVTHAYKTKTGCWHYTRGEVFRVADNVRIADVKRNYSSFWRAWLTHEGKEYLLCGEDYQGYGFIDLESGQSKFHLPQTAKKGHGFCWISATPSPDGKFIAVIGCIWAGPEELTIYEFNPQGPPFLMLCAESPANSMESVKWTPEGLSYTHAVEIRKSDRKPIRELSAEEQDKTYDTMDWDEMESPPKLLIPPGTFEIFQNVMATYAWQKAAGSAEGMADTEFELKALEARLTPEEKAKLPELWRQAHAKAEEEEAKWRARMKKMSS